jgi:hypothetical protein
MMEVMVTIYRPDMITIEQVLKITQYILLNEQIEN